MNKDELPRALRRLYDQQARSIQELGTPAYEELDLFMARAGPFPRIVRGPELDVIRSSRLELPLLERGQQLCINNDLGPHPAVEAARLREVCKALVSANAPSNAVERHEKRLAKLEAGVDSPQQWEWRQFPRDHALYSGLTVETKSLSKTIALITALLPRALSASETAAVHAFERSRRSFQPSPPTCGQTSELGRAVESTTQHILLSREVTDPDIPEVRLARVFTEEQCGAESVYWALWLDHCWMPAWCDTARGERWTPSLAIEVTAATPRGVSG